MMKVKQYAKSRCEHARSYSHSMQRKSSPVSRLGWGALAMICAGIPGRLPAVPIEVAGENVPPGFVVVEGDMLVPAENTSGTYRSLLWPGGVVPYVFAPDVTAMNRQRMLDAMNEWESVAGVDFRPRGLEANYVVINNDTGNSAVVGMVGGSQPVNIYSWDHRFILVHELGHTLGLWHEQSRFDRGSACDGSPCIVVNEDNISQTACGGTPCNSNFAVRPSPGGEVNSYDFDSVMHYSQCAFSTNPNCPVGGGQTITVPPPNAAWQGMIGQRSHLSQGDVATMDYLYPGGRTCPGMIVNSVPTDGAIDARRPFDPNAGSPVGWDQFVLTFDGDPSHLGLLDFAIGASSGAPPVIMDMLVDGNDVTIMLDRPLDPGGWTTLIVKPCCDGIQVGYLPADTSQDGVSGPPDILDLINCLGNMTSCPLHATDIDRSGVSDAPDILRLIDLLNGAGEFLPWTNQTLPQSPDVWLERIRPPVGLIGIPVSGEYQVTVCRNSEGPAVLTVPLEVTVGDPPVTFNALESIDLERNCCATRSVYVPTPAVEFACGGYTRFPVQACANLNQDVHGANDCAVSHVDVEPAYYDLVYEVVENPLDSCAGQQVCWDVQVCNTGNITSLPTSSQTGICPDDGFDYFPCVTGTPYPFIVPPIPPRQCWVSNPGFCVTPLPGAFQQQFVKAGTVPANADVCLGGNQDDDPITIGYPDLIIQNVDGPEGACGTQSFDAEFDVCNTGSCSAMGTFTVGGWISLDGNPFDGQNDIGIGTRPVNLSSPLLPGECRSFDFTSLNLPSNTLVTSQELVFCADVVGGPPCRMVCEANENNNCSSTDVDVVPLNVGVTDVSAPSNVWGCVGPRTYTATARNFSGCDVRDLRMKVCVGNLASVCCGPFCFEPCGYSEPFDLMAGESHTVEVSIFTPPVFGFCGQSISFNLSACLWNWADFNNNDNCRNEQMYIRVPCGDSDEGAAEENATLTVE